MNNKALNLISLGAFRKFFELMLLCCLIFRCSDKHSSTIDYQVVDLSGASQERDENPLSLGLFIDGDMEYVVLETSPDFIINENFVRVYADKHYIVVVGFKQMYLFSRDNGKFIKEIGRYGKGPGEYAATLYFDCYNEENQTLTAELWDQGSYINYSLKDQTIKKKSFNCPDIGQYTHGVYSLDENNFVVHYNNSPIHNQKRLLLFNRNCRIINTYYYPDGLGTNHKSTFLYGNVKFHRFEEKLLFFEWFQDTVFQITSENLFPRYVFNFGNYAPPIESQFDSKYYREGESEKFFHIGSIIESDRYLFIRFSFNGNPNWYSLFDKTTNETFIGDTDSGFANNIDFTFPLMHPTSVNSSGELVGYTPAYKIVDWLENNNDKIHCLPENLLGLKNITQNDNPVVMIAKLKE